MNQDYVYASDQPVGNLKNLLIVADGMGGHNAGDLASRYTVQEMLAYIKESEEDRPVPLLSMAIHHANEQVLEKAESEKELEKSFINNNSSPGGSRSCRLWKRKCNRKYSRTDRAAG